MKILLVNVPHLAIGSRLAGEHLPPLGLLAVAGPLIDDGHEVALLDADYAAEHHGMKLDRLVEEVLRRNPELVLFGHSGSSTAQPIIEEVSGKIREKNPAIRMILGGVYPTFHWREILKKHPQFDFIVLGEGEAVCRELVETLATDRSPEGVRGIAYLSGGEPVQTPPAPLIENLDDYRVAWELMADYHYTYWGGKKAVVIQFSRGCPFPCKYCGQSLFWKKWRHRDPRRLADELEMLHRDYGVEVVNFADENMAVRPESWREFLEILIEKNLNLALVGSIRADSIVRDADFLHLYKKAGFERFLLGIENYDESVLRQINKSASMSDDRRAIQLLRQHDILSMATYVVGFGSETIGDFYRSLRQLLSYDPDQIQLVYVAPHRWTPWFEEIRDKEIILTDTRKWDYKHQVLRNERLPAWMVTLCVKTIEVAMQARPKAICRLLFHRDPKLRRAMRWYTWIGRRVWFSELFQFFFVTKLERRSIRLGDFLLETETAEKSPAPSVSAGPTSR